MEIRKAITAIAGVLYLGSIYAAGLFEVSLSILYALVAVSASVIYMLVTRQDELGEGRVYLEAISAWMTANSQFMVAVLGVVSAAVFLWGVSWLLRKYVRASFVVVPALCILFFEAVLKAILKLDGIHETNFYTFFVREYILHVQTYSYLLAYGSLAWFFMQNKVRFGQVGTVLVLTSLSLALTPLFLHNIFQYLYFVGFLIEIFGLVLSMAYSWMLFAFHASLVWLMWQDAAGSQSRKN